MRLRAGAAIDVADESVAAEAVDLALERFGRLNYLVNNTGTTAGGADLSLESVAEFDRIMAVNVRGPYHLAVRAALAMADGWRSPGTTASGSGPTTSARSSPRSPGSP